MPRVLIGAPVHNREQLLPTYLCSLVIQHIDKFPVDYCFVLNNCNEETWSIMNTFQETFSSRFKVQLIRMDDLQSYPKRAHDIKRYQLLATVRNRLLEEVTDDYTHFFSVDTDIVVIPDVLTKLLSDDKDVCAALVYNDLLRVNKQKDRTDWPFRKLNVMRFSERDGKKTLNHFQDFPKDDVFPVDVTGAVYLMKQKVARDCRYAAHVNGEDVPFCIDAKEKGYELWADSALLCEHIMEF